MAEHPVSAAAENQLIMRCAGAGARAGEKPVGKGGLAPSSSPNSTRETPVVRCLTHFITGLTSLLDPIQVRVAAQVDLAIDRRQAGQHAAWNVVGR